MSTTYDVIVIGGGPAGLTAAIYATRSGLSTAVFERNAFGGQVTQTDEIDNYPALENVTGTELSEKMHAHAQNLGADIRFDEITGLKTALSASSTCGFTITSFEGETEAKAVIYAAGANPTHVGFDGEEQFAGHGVSYCATCDGMFYKNKDVFVIGGGNTACEEALYLSKLARSVTMLVRKNYLRAVKSLQDKVIQNEKITVRYLTKLVSISGSGMLPDTAILAHTETGETETVSFGAPFGVFVAVGRIPETELLQGLVQFSDSGYVLTDDGMATGTPGLFVAGDVRAKQLRQIITACADGAIAADSAAKYIEGL